MLRATWSPSLPDGAGSSARSPICCTRASRPASVTCREWITRWTAALPCRRWRRRIAWARAAGSASRSDVIVPESSGCGASERSSSCSSSSSSPGLRRAALAIADPDQLVEVLEVGLEREPALLAVLLRDGADEVAHLDHVAVVGGLEGGGERAVLDRAAREPVVRGEDHRAGVALHLLQEVGDLDVGVAVVGVRDLRALAEQRVGLVEEEDRVGALRR